MKKFKFKFHISGEITINGDGHVFAESLLAAMTKAKEKLVEQFHVAEQQVTLASVQQVRG
jgi:hypothetical protein